ncbi:MAG: BMC domain-containing protein [Lachnospiraceae bacterium]
MYTEKALGMIEILGRTGAVEALDAALKAADVELVSMVRVGGGITTIFFEGDVAACKASCEAGGAAADRISKVLSVHVIPRPDPSVRAMLDQDRSGYYEGGRFPYYDPDNYDSRADEEIKDETDAAPAVQSRAAEETPAAQAAAPEMPEAAKAPEPAEAAAAPEAKEAAQTKTAPEAKEAAQTKAAPEAGEIALSDEELNGMTVNQLRRLARATDGYPLSRQEIKFAKKDELLIFFRQIRKQ